MALFLLAKVPTTTCFVATKVLSKRCDAVLKAGGLSVLEPPPSIIPTTTTTTTTTTEPYTSHPKAKQSRAETAKSTATTSNNSLVSNQGQTATFMLYWPSITTFTLVDGWTASHTTRLKQAVETVVQRNPILTGRARTSGFWGRNTKVSIQPGVFDAKSIVHHVDFSWCRDMMFDNTTNLACSLTPHEWIRFLDNHVAPLVPPAESVVESIKSGNPLFRVDLITLPAGHACWAVRLSHCVGDGVTYYNIMKEINHYFNHPVSSSCEGDAIHQNNGDQRQHDKESPPAPLDWTAPDIANHEIWPSRYSKADVQKAYGFPFLLGLLRNVVHMETKQIKDYLVLDKKKIEAKKQELVDKNQHNHLSSNDIITAALCQANQSSDLFCFTMNMRYLPDCRHYGFNFHNEVPFPSKVAAGNPNAFRSIVKQGYYYDTNQVPTWPFVLGRVGRLSSLSSVQHVIADKKDNHVLFHGLLASYVQNVPLDVAFIVSMNDDNFLVVHNFRQLDKKEGLLRDILAE